MWSICAEPEVCCGGKRVVRVGLMVLREQVVHLCCLSKFSGRKVFESRISSVIFVFVLPCFQRFLTPANELYYVSLRCPSCSLPLKLSMKALCVGLTGAMQCQLIPASCTLSGMARLVNSVPLSNTIVPGFPCLAMILYSSHVIHRSDRNVSALKRGTPDGPVEIGVDSRSQPTN